MEMRIVTWVITTLTHAGLVFLLFGCSAVQQSFGINATDLSWIKLGMQRTEIETILGRGEIKNSTNGFGEAVIHEFDRGYIPPKHKRPLLVPATALGWEAMNLLSLGSRSYWERECQRAKLELYYDQMNILVRAKEYMVDQGNLNSGTRDICNRIRHNLAPSTLSVNIIPMTN